MRTQAVVVIVIFTAVMIAVPLLNNHRMNAGALIGGIVTFVGLPFLAGIMQSKPSQAMLLAAGVLLSLCPLVYIVTDTLAVQFEKLRDGHFLATGATIIFISAAWVAYSYRTRRWFAHFAGMLHVMDILVP